MADVRMRPGLFGRRTTWRWCLAGGGALCILVGIALGVPSGAAQGGNGEPHASTASTVPHDSARSTGATTGAAGTSTTANPATGLAAPLPVGSSDGTSVALAQPVATTLPTPQALGVGAAPAAQAVPITTTAALLICVIGVGAFGAGWSIGRRRALAQG